MSEEEWEEFLEYVKEHAPNTIMSEEDLRKYFNFMTGDYKTEMEKLREDSEKQAEVLLKFRTLYFQRQEYHRNFLNNIRQQKYLKFSEFLKAEKEWELTMKKYNNDLDKICSTSGLDDLDKLRSEFGPLKERFRKEGRK